MRHYLMDALVLLAAVVIGAVLAVAVLALTPLAVVVCCVAAVAVVLRDWRGIRQRAAAQALASMRVELDDMAAHLDQACDWQEAERAAQMAEWMDLKASIPTWTVVADSDREAAERVIARVKGWAA